MKLDCSDALIEYLEIEFPGARVRESTSECEKRPLMRCFRVEDGKNRHLLVVASSLLATRTDDELRGLLDDADAADHLFRARGSPVLLTEDGPRLVE